MKKHLIAAAVAGALAVPAMAQVSISGALEAGYISKKNADKSTNSTVDTIVGTPNITFKGSEDLGGGLKAGFTLKQNIDTPTGGQTGFNTSRLDLSGGFGKISLGRFDAAGRDFGGVYRFFGDIGRLVSAMNPGGDQVNNFMYTTPKFNGFSAAFSDSRGAGRTTISAAAEKVSSYILRGDIAGFKVAYAATEKKAANTGATSDKITGLAGSYNFGVARVGIVSAKRETTVDVKALGLHAAAPVGPVTLGFSNTTYEESGNDKETKIMTLAAKYSLSKRTAIYGTWQKITKDTAGIATGMDKTRSMDLFTPTSGTSNSGYGISVEHKF
jgi:predicted porin